MKTSSALVHDVLLIVIGFLLSQVNNLFADRRERKKAISSALSDLLEVRSHFVGLERIAEQIGNLVGSIPEHEKSQMRVTFDSVLPKWDELHSRYDQSVTTLAGLDPLLAYRLRSKDFIRPLLTLLYSLMGKDPQAAAVMGPIMKTKLVGKVEPILDEAILALAKKRNRLCWYRTKRLLKNEKQLPDGFIEFLESIKSAVPVPKCATTEPQVSVPRMGATPGDSVLK